ncbi:Hypothetical protein A7982_03863 [Minicystis rosea]|nr:Hypothetical protein A7982_03863 [Minicystis rosea]
MIMVHKIRNAEGTEEEIDALVDRLDEAVVHPMPINVIFWDSRFTNASDEEIVDELLNYKPIPL